MNDYEDQRHNFLYTHVIRVHPVYPAMRIEVHPYFDLPVQSGGVNIPIIRFDRAKLEAALILISNVVDYYENEGYLIEVKEGLTDWSVTDIEKLLTNQIGAHHEPFTAKK